MPRPKVKPQDRRRSAKACASCKISKVRCDSLQPCQPCVRRGRTCSYTASSTSAATSTSSVQRPLPDQQATSSTSPTADNEFSPCSADTVDTVETVETEGRMVMSSDGERMYVGAISSLSLLEFLRQVLRRHMGPSSFTETANNDMTLEIDQHHQSTDLLESVDLDVDAYAKHTLVQSYFEVTSAILQTYTRDEVSQFSVESTTYDAVTGKIGVGKRRHGDLAAMYLVLAIGGQCHANYQEVATVYFHKGQQIAFKSMLCEPSVDMIRHFVLLAFYMLGACRRNTAYMYLGVAWRAACTLGLHRKDQCNNCTREEIGVRLRTWRSLRILDTLVNSIMGRSTSTSHFHPDIDDLNHLVHTTNNNPALEATYGISLLIDKVSTSCGKVDFTTAEHLLQDLRDWSEGLPNELRSFDPITASTNDSRSASECLIGATHVACSYYFAVILVTRQFFISHLVNTLRSKDSETCANLDAQELESAQQAKLARTCLESAIYMAKLCTEAIKSTLLHQNMTILTAWTFVAGLLLGFSMFVKDTFDTRSETATAFASCCTVLKYFSKLNPQAGHYYDILVYFDNAIRKHHQQTTADKYSFGDHYVTQILTIATPQLAGMQQDIVQEAGSATLESQIGTTTFATGAFNDIDFLSADLWDDFLLDNQPLTMFF